MATPRKHDSDSILDAARTVLLRDGPRAASVAAIACESGAPAGTLYHRFGNRDGVLAAAWLRALEGFQRRALRASCEHADPLEAAVAMACSQIIFAREQPDDARLLLTLRRDDLLDSDPDRRLRERLEEINEPLRRRLAELTKQIAGASDERSSDRVTRAVVELPNAAVRRHARDGGRLPDWLEEDLAVAVRRLLAP
jgi:AcrR family transcriptional regulator